MYFFIIYQDKIEGVFQFHSTEKNGYQVSEKNKSLYPNCTLFTQDICTHLYSNKRNNYSV